jgi:RNA polymerase sigma-70 factor (ECF subfamily)
VKDDVIIQGLKRREKIVFDYVFNYYYSSLCAFSVRYVQDRRVAEDLVQDFFVFLWLECHNLTVRVSLKSYLFSAIKNRSLDILKHQKVTEKYRAHILQTASLDEDAVGDFLAESELRKVIQISMGKLPPRCREIFELSRVQGLSNQEISERLDLSKRTVELQISNSLKILRGELADYLPIWIIVWLLQ